MSQAVSTSFFAYAASNPSTTLHRRWRLMHRDPATNCLRNVKQIRTAHITCALASGARQPRPELSLEQVELGGK
jgi:hypothetical protein